MHQDEKSIVPLPLPFCPPPQTLLFCGSLPMDNLHPDPLDLPSQLLSILCCPNWQKHPSVKKLSPPYPPPMSLSSLPRPRSPDHPRVLPLARISEKPMFNHNIHSHSPFLNVLVLFNHLGAAKKIWISMISLCKLLSGGWIAKMLSFGSA